MKVTLIPSRLNGRINAIASKSDVHRRLICMALSKSGSELSFKGTSEDIEASVRCLCALGADIRRTRSGACVTPGKAPDRAFLDCGESGSTLRFLLPAAAALVSLTEVTGAGRLPERPLGELIGALKSGGVEFSAERLPLVMRGRLRGGEYSLPGNVSSQYISGMLLALPLLPEDSVLRLTSSLESSGYVDMTVKALSDFGVKLSPFEGGWRITGGQTYTPPRVLRAEGDWSNSAFWLCAGAIGDAVCVSGLDMLSLQRDKSVAALLRAFGAQVIANESCVAVQSGSLKGISIDASEIPDLVPVLAVTACAAEGETLIYNAARLRLKESDRLSSVAKLITGLGGSCLEREDSLLIRGSGTLRGGTVDSHGDHRIAMAAAVASIICKDRVTICAAEAVNKSYPEFFNDMESLGGQLQ